MKKAILALTVLAIAAAGMNTAKAGDREWAVAGKVLTGLFVASAINHAIADQRPCAPVYYSGPAPCVRYDYGYSYCPPPRVVYQAPSYCAPAPVIVYRHAAPVIVQRYGYGRDYRSSHHGRW